MPFIPHSEADVLSMLKTIGVQRIEDLFDEIPPALKIDQLRQVPTGLNEMDVTRLMKARGSSPSRTISSNNLGPLREIATTIPGRAWSSSAQLLRRPS